LIRGGTHSIKVGNIVINYIIIKRLYILSKKMETFESDQ
jgi:hypothetical protein